MFSLRLIALKGEGSHSINALKNDITIILNASIVIYSMFLGFIACLSVDFTPLVQHLPPSQKNHPPGTVTQ